MVSEPGVTRSLSGGADLQRVMAQPPSAGDVEQSPH